MRGGERKARDLPTVSPWERKTKRGRALRYELGPPNRIYQNHPLIHPNSFLGSLVSKRVQVSFNVVDFKLIEACTQSDNTRDYTSEKVSFRFSDFDNHSYHLH